MSLDLEQERQAIALAQAGDPRALEPLLAAHAEDLFAVVLQRLGDRAEAEDVLRETFVTAIEKIGSFSWQGRSLFFWLRQIALHKVIDVHRARGRSQRLCESLAAEIAATHAEVPADLALIREQDRRRARERTEAAMAAIPPRYAQAIRLRLVEERPREACAEAMGVALGNFDVILFRAVRSFRAAYGERDA